MTKSTRKKWKRANRMMDIATDRPYGPGRYGALYWWTDKNEWDHRTTASLALDGLSIKELP